MGQELAAQISGESSFLFPNLFQTSEEWINWAIVIGHLLLGPCFVVHGLGKLGVVGPGNLKGFEGWLKALGVPAPHLQAKAAMVSEIVGGTLLTLGLFTRPTCILLFFVMSVATLIGHRGGGYLITNDPPGNEYAFNLAGLMVVFFLLGSGKYSLDALFFLS